MASHSKALCDRLLHDLRLDPDTLAGLSLDDLRHCLSAGFKQRQLRTLLQVVDVLQQELG
jgi:hypothetical protein